MKNLGLLALSMVLIASCATSSPQPGSGVKEASLGSYKIADILAKAEPKNLIRADFAPGEITAMCDAAMNETMLRMDAIAKIPSKERTFDNTMLALETAFAEVNDVVQPLTFMAYVSTDQKLHDEGAACEEKFGPFFVGIMTRKDIYEAVKEPKARTTAEKRLREETLREFEKNGMKLSTEKLAEFKDLKQRLSVMESQFSTNSNADNTVVEFDAKELEGVSADFLTRLKKSPSGKYIATTKYTDYTEVMENAVSEDTRKRMLTAYTNRAADKNVKLLEDAILLREQIAKLMGYATWADYRTDGRMAKNGKIVSDFLDGLKVKLAERNKKDLAKLLQFKKEKNPSAQEIKAWDINYLAYQLKKRDYNLDEELVKEYFPADRVIKGVFDIYSKLLGVRFEEVKDAKVWATGVTFYRILDGKTGAELAYFYADFFPRPLKYSHFAAFNLVQGRVKVDGYNKPVSAIVGNFSPPANGKPSLMKHEEVETFFHEFGHIMHQTLTKAPYTSLAGSNVAQDFVEAISQMFENWVWNKKILKELSGHYLDPSKKIPDQMVDKMIAAKDFNKGYFYTRQLVLGLTDMKYHTASGSVDTTAVYNRLYKELLGVDPLLEGHFQASFGHLMNGYDAGYYGYLWSEVYAEDLFTKFAEKDQLLSPKVGRSYRTHILEQGKMEDAGVLMKKFLGREPNSKAFFKRLGIKG